MSRFFFGIKFFEIDKNISIILRNMFTAFFNMNPPRVTVWSLSAVVVL